MRPERRKSHKGDLSVIAGARSIRWGRAPELMLSLNRHPLG